MFIACHGRFINWNKGAAVVWDVHMGEASHAGVVRERSRECVGTLYFLFKC